MTARRARTVGLVLAVLYGVTLVVSMAVRGDGVRPLYDGVVPPDSYRWVDPPPFFASGNTKPKRVTATFAPTGAIGLGAPDGQFVIDIAAGALVVPPGTASVRVAIDPVAPKTLAALPDGLRGDGNAYRVTMAAQPSGRSIGTLSRAGTAVMEIPEVGSRVFASSDGARWSEVPAHTFGPRELSVAAPFARAGYYVVGTSLPELVAARHATHTSLVWGIVVAIVAVAVLAAAALLVRRRHSG